ncbi:DNA methyltransferase [Thermomonas brevis]
MSHDAIRAYLAAIEAALKAGNATEHTHRPALKVLLEAIGGNDVRATNEPQRIACGAPDYILTRGVVPLGYVEAKDVGKPLDTIERDEQLTRYRESLGNLILTDYLEFRWYLDGELRLTASLPRPDRNGRIRWNADAASGVTQLLGQFIAADLPLRATPKDLATRMAGLAKLIRGLITQTFKAEDGEGELHAQLSAFRSVLIESLTPEQFADMYAQTLAYGLFAARCNAPGTGFTRQSAASQLPKTNPFLRKLFHSIAGPDLDERIAWAVDQLAELLARADMSAILEDFGRRTRREDPVVHFYETFLAAYDQKMREARGVYYTPEPVVNWIVRSIDSLLRRDFGIGEGLAHAGKVRLLRAAEPRSSGKAKASQAKAAPIESYETHKVQILDPATGTGTFLYAVIQKIREHFDGNAGAWPGYVAEHLLPRLFGFELLMAPYAVAHMKLGLELEQSGYDFASDKRLGVFLTNSLEEAHELTGLPLFTQWLADESRAAASVKRDAPVMVVLGNPPYSGHSVNNSPWITDLMSEYKQSPELKKPAQAKWLNDDYVKFIRFAQWRIEQTGHGVLGFVTNHGYLDNPTFMDMRRSLLRSFDDIYILDLHGNSKKKEKTPEGGKDENVFDIQQGVAIGLFVRTGQNAYDEGHRARVWRGDLYGPREEKYAALDNGDVASWEWAAVEVKEPAFLFNFRDEKIVQEYERNFRLGEVFGEINEPVPGFATQHDDFAISWGPQTAVAKVAALLATRDETEAREQFNLCTQSQWQYQRAKSELPHVDLDEALLSLSYRPFDTRWTVDNRNVLVHRRRRITDQMLRPNLALVMPKNAEAFGGVDQGPYFVVSRPADLNLYRRGGAYLLPLWVHGSDLLIITPSTGRPNLAPQFLEDFATAIGHAPAPEDVLAWIYAVLYTPSYRSRYADQLKRDFPRIPLPPNAALYQRLRDIGAELIALHVMDQTLPRITRFDVAGDNRVDKVRWSADGSGTGRVWINATQHFDRVPQAVWDMHIGGYRVAEKWLKDRKARALSYDDLEHYQRVIAALARTLELQDELDAAIARAGGWPLAKQGGNA